MVVDNFDVDRFPLMPNEAYPVTIIDPDTVLSGAVFPKRL